MAWEGQSIATHLPEGFAVFRAETNHLQCSAEVMLPSNARDAERDWTGDSVQLLCRALRLAPPCYRRVELAASCPDDTVIMIEGGVMLYREGRERSWRTAPPAVFVDIPGLASAMQRYAAVERLIVQTSPDQHSVIVRRISNELLGSAAAVQ